MESSSYIIIDGDRYYSDRFYLNAPSGLPYYNPSTQVAYQDIQKKHSKFCCSNDREVEKCKHKHRSECKCQLQPPLFDRARLIQSLDLKAAIVGTYVLDPIWISKEIPDLFPPPSKDDIKIDGFENDVEEQYIPTLLLHGHKSLRNSNIQIRRQKVKKENSHAACIANSVNDQRLSNNSLSSKKKSDDPIPTNCSMKRKRNSLKNDRCNQIEEVICIDDDSDDEIVYVKHIPGDKNDKAKNKKLMIMKKKKKNDLEQRKEKIKRKNIDIQKLASKHRKKLFREPNFLGSDQNEQPCNEGKVKILENNQPQRIDYSIRSNGSNDLKIFGNSVHVTQVLPQWIPPDGPTSIEQKRDKDTNHIQSSSHNKTSTNNNNNNNNVIFLMDSSDDEKKANSDNPSTKIKEQHPPYQDKSNGMNQKRKKRLMGVHHPKFMLLFEKSGSVIVSVSTSNLTRPRGVDGTWLQRFYPNHNTPEEYSPYAQRKQKKDASDGSDFGFVLCDLLQRQSDAAENGGMTPSMFLKRYLGMSSLREMQKRYAFHTADVHLVSTVPGSHPGRFGTKHLSKIHGVVPGRCDRRIFYGPQRVSDILHKCTFSSNPCLPSKYLSTSDKLIVQTTSFGSKWNKERFVEMIEQYMGLDDPKMSNVDTSELIHQIDILWPSERFMDDVKKEIELKWRQNEKCGIGDNGTETVAAATTTPFEDFTFLSSDTFNLIDQECLSRMTKYEELTPSLLPHKMSPHIKTYGRIMTKFYKEKSKSKMKHGEEKEEKERRNSYFAWFMLTSACLSRGAQGYAENNGSFESFMDEKTYLNFELGVLFCSRLQGNPMTDRLYGCYPKSNCTCYDRFQVVNLPVPYKIHSLPYQQDDELDFDENPHMNDISPNSAVKGNMALTPLGKKMRSML